MSSSLKQFLITLKLISSYPGLLFFVKNNSSLISIIVRDCRHGCVYFYGCAYFFKTTFKWPWRIWYFFGQVRANICEKILNSFAISSLPDTSCLLIQGFPGKWGSDFRVLPIIYFITFHVFCSINVFDYFLGVITFLKFVFFYSNMFLYTLYSASLCFVLFIFFLKNKIYSFSFFLTDFLLPFVIQGLNCLCGFNLTLIFGIHSLYKERKISIILLYPLLTFVYFRYCSIDIT